MIKETKPIRISNSVHKKLKVYAAQAEENIVEVVDIAVLRLMAETPPSQLKSSKQSKNK